MRTFILIIAVLMFFITGCQSPVNNDQSLKKSTSVDYVDNPPLFRDGVGPSILIMGDSRGEQGGTFDALPNPVYNLAVGGSSTESILNKLYRINDISPKYIFIFTGINDMAVMGTDTFRLFLTYSVDYMVNSGAKVYIMDQAANSAGTNSSQTYQYLMVMMFINHSNYVPLLLKASDYSDNVCHLNASGYLKVTREISKIINNQ